MKSPLAYIGGKSKLAGTIIDQIPDHRTYCEVFAGAGWVFFKKEPSRREVINDLDGDLIAFYRVLQHHLEEFLRQFKWLLSSREVFADFIRQQEAGGLTDIQRAARYYYLQRQCFGGRVKGRTFGTDPDGPPRINLVRMEEELSQVYLRLTGVTIEHLPWQDLVRRYDRARAFFYLDPPYYKAPYYNHNMALPDYVEMAEILAGIKARFLLSLNDHPDIREVFKAFKMEAVALNYTVAKKQQTRASELLISNY